MTPKRLEEIKALKYELGGHNGMTFAKAVNDHANEYKPETDYSYRCYTAINDLLEYVEVMSHQVDKVIAQLTKDQTPSA